ncbi:hypothetical protein STSP2_02066 [Anaerohalosphaera lusitana]|uniref:Uncharacterized protein n=1 Tax=Anaerohalosphaera lusitana TaxID=1936003 RepID=A0A1U9NLV8_9BACT|nr:hypothetical protein STSP2_02066 [Anaerohalosphaera lusitana]
MLEYMQETGDMLEVCMVSGYNQKVTGSSILFSA